MQKRNTYSGTLGAGALGAMCIAILITSAVDASAAAWLDCDTLKDEAQIIDCLRFQVIETDAELNHQYNRLLEGGSAKEYDALKLSQRDWLQRRNRHCHTNHGESDRKTWLLGVSRNYAKAACIVLFTKGRIAELREAEAKRIVRKSTRSAPDASPASYPSVASTWGAVLNPAGNIPVGEFKAFYFDSRRPHTTVAFDIVKDVSINYSWDKFHSIPSEHFGAYWVGRLRFSKPSEKIISISQGWAKTRVVIDKQLVYEGGSDAQVPFAFSAGDHLVEVEYVNNWHTTEFAVDISNPSPLLSLPELRHALGDARYRSAKVLYAGLYESSSRYLTTSIIVAATEDPVVLVLSSYSTVKWEILNPHRVDIKAVVFGSHAPGSRVGGDLDDSTEVIPIKGRIGTYKTLPTCKCVGGRYHCDGGNLKRTALNLERATGLPVAGFSGKYKAESLDLPERIVADAILETEAGLQTLAKKAVECKRQGTPDFDYLLKKQQ